MRYLSVGICIVIILIVIGVNRTSHEKPTINVVGSINYDAGMVSGNSPIIHSFHIQNPHSFPLHITATPGCDCTKVSMQSDIIAAHGSGDITMRVQPESKEINAGVSVVSSHGKESEEIWLLLTAKKSDKETKTR